jgi:hypothetical protein
MHSTTNINLPVKDAHGCVEVPIPYIVRCYGLLNKSYSLLLLLLLCRKGRIKLELFFITIMQKGQHRI